MIEVETIRAKLKTHNLSKVALESGVDKHTMYRLMNERSKPSYETVKKLVEWMGAEGLL